MLCGASRKENINHMVCTKKEQRKKKNKLDVFLARHRSRARDRQSRRLRNESTPVPRPPRFDFPLAPIQCNRLASIIIKYENILHKSLTCVCSCVSVNQRAFVRACVRLSCVRNTKQPTHRARFPRWIFCAVEL